MSGSKVQQTREELVATFEQILSKEPSKQLPYSKQVFEFRTVTKHGWTGEQMEKYGTMQSFLKSESGTFVLLQNNLIVALRNAQVAVPQMLHPSEEELQEAPALARKRELRTQQFCEDDVERPGKDRSCAPKATTWGLQVPLMLVFCCFMNAMILYIAVKRRILNEELVSSMPLLQQYQDFVDELIKDLF